MREARVAIYHHGCYGSRCTEKFPEVVVRSITPGYIVKHKNNRIYHNALWEISAPSKIVLSNFIKYTKNSKNMDEVLPLQREDKKAILSLTQVANSSTYETVIKNKASYSGGIAYENSYEIHDIVAPSMNEISKTLSGLEEIGEVRILKIRDFSKEKSQYGLTDKQRQAIIVALKNDYYSWPRKITLEELAFKLGTTRRAFQENLRKAEEKFFPRVIEEHLNK